jgi:uncharacterized membrane protein
MTKWILFVHVLSAMWLATGAFGGAIARAQGRKALDLPGKVAALRMGVRMASVFGLPGSLAAGLTGLSLLDPMGFGFRPGWVHASVGIWLVILGLVLLYLRPRANRMLAAAEESLAAGAPNDELKRLASSKLARALADLPALGVVALVLLMVVKPF